MNDCVRVFGPAGCLTLRRDGRKRIGEFEEDLRGLRLQPWGLRLDPTRFISNRRIKGDVRGAVSQRESRRKTKIPPLHPAGVSR